MARNEKRENDKDTKERRKGSGDGDCFAGDMIILSLSVFKEDIAR